MNAFQTQDPSAVEDTPSSWPRNLLVHDGGSVLMDPDWNEAFLDISTAANRTAIATRIEKHIDQCATKGFGAIELDNYDSYTRLLTRKRMPSIRAHTPRPPKVRSWAMPTPTEPT
nr:endo alpha-1,4 polygalactosaminidase [Streptomyces sp. L2]